MTAFSSFRFGPELGWSLLVVALVPWGGLPAQQGNEPADREVRLREAERLNGELMKLGNQGRFRDAVPIAKQVLAIRQEILGENHADTAQSLNNLGSLLQAQVDYAAARQCFEQALKIRRKVLGEEHPDTATSLNKLGYLLYSQGDYAVARPYYEAALKINKKVLGDEHPDTATLFNNLAALLIAQGDNSPARLYHEQALKIRRKVLGEGHPDTANSLNNLGNLLDSQGDYATARPYLEQALKIRKKALGEGHPVTATSLNNLGALLEHQGDYPAARPYFEQALKITKKVLGEEHPSTAASLNNLGHLLQAQGDYVAARSYYEQALKINKKVLGEEHSLTAAALNNVGYLLSAQGDYAAARPYHEQALKIRKKVLGEEHPDTALSLHNLGSLLQAQGDYEAARTYFEEALKIKKKVLGEEHPDTALSLNNFLILEMSLGKSARAITLMDQSRRRVRRHLAHVLPSLSDKEQLLFLQNKDDANFQVALSLGWHERIEANAVQKSVAWLLNGKGVAQTALAERNLLTRDVKNPEVAGTIEKLSDVRRQLANLAISIPKPGNEQARKDNLDRLAADEASLTREVAQKTARPELVADPWVELEAVRQAIPADGLLIELARFKVFDFQALGKQKKWQPARYAAWIIPPKGKGNVELVDLGPAEVIDGEVKSVVAAIASAAKPDGALQTVGAPEANRAVLAQLARIRDLVWQPLADKIPAGTKRLILSPDGNLWLLPWNALPVQDDKSLLEAYVVHLEISGRELVRPRGAVGRSNPPVILADPDYDLAPEAARQSMQAIFPKLNLDDTSTRGAISQTAISKVPRLPSTAYEAEAVAPNMQQVATAAPSKYVGQWALESVIKRTNRPKVLMLSTHGFFLPDQEVKRDDREGFGTSTDTRSAALLTLDGKPIENPLLRCGLLFAGCNSQQAVGGDEGVLTGMEVVSLDLRGTELVVLSACETGTGQVRNGQGVAGLRQAFQLAGAESVVATLWQVPDRDSALIMNDFFKNLAAGQSRPEALRNAQLTRIEKRRERDGAAHPFFWAAWTITGR